MRRLSGDARLTLGLLAVLILILIASAIWKAGTNTNYPPLVSLSNQPDGSRALRLSLQALGYQVTDRVEGDFAPSKATRIALLLEPFPGIEDGEWDALDEWVKQGGTLILAGDDFGAFLAAQHYHFGLNYLDQASEALSQQAPLLTSPPLQGTATVKPDAYFDTLGEDSVVLMAVDSRPVLVTVKNGEGRLILSASAYPFSNAGLKEAGNPSLVLNLIALGAAPDSRIWFDEWHHGLRSSQEIVGPGNWLRYTPSGRALLYIAVVIFVVLALQGQNFGRPLTPQRPVYRRAPLEYITAIANLSRRAGHRRWVLLQYHNALKRHYTRRYRINPALQDSEFVAELSRYHPSLDPAALLGLLQRLDQSRVSEAEAIQLAAETVEWLES
jgi:hypothetical protein